MIKWIVRTLVILAVAGLIAGGAYLFSQSEAASNFSAGPGEGFERGFVEGSIRQDDGEGLVLGDERPAFEGRDGERHEASLGRGIGEVLKVLVQVTLVVLAVLGVQKLWPKLEGLARRGKTAAG